MAKRKTPQAQQVALEERAGELMTVPLSLLVPSERNVRKQYATTVEQLAASIDAQGLLQNLTVIEQRDAKGKPTGYYEVVAGGRRLQALMLLAKGRKIAADEPILCKVTRTEQARLASLAENIGQEPMHPADEFDAWKALVDEGRTVEEVAGRFGVTPLTVQRRLRLANVAPELIAEFRKGAATLDQLMALAITDDQQAQRDLWANTPPYHRNGDYLRRQLLADEVDARTDPVARFVGLAAYEKAGGVVRRDLFADEGAGYIADPALLTKLALVKLDKAARKVMAEGWAWVNTCPRPDYQTLAVYGRAKPTPRAPTEDEQAAMQKLEEAARKLEWRVQELREAGKDDEAEDVADELANLGDRIETLRDECVEWAVETKAVCGALVLLDRQGKIDVQRGMIRPEDKRLTPAVAASADVDQPATSPADKRDHSEALLRNLTAHRTLALQAQMFGNAQDVALAALAHTLAERVLLAQRTTPYTALKVTATDQWSALAAAAGADVEQTLAWAAMREACARWTEKVTAGGRDTLTNILALSRDELQELLALCAALTLNAVYPLAADEQVDQLTKAAALDMAQWWSATAARYFNAVPKARILAVLRENCPPEVLADAAKLKKNDLAQRAEQLLAGAGWLPEPLRS